MGPSSERSNASKWRNHSNSKVSNALCNGASSGNPEDLRLTLEDRAARRIQTAFRGFRARRALRRLKGLQRLQVIGQGYSIKKQTSTTLSYVQSWSKIQAEIRTRRVYMVTEGRIKQKKQENQLKLEAKLHDIEVDWCGGSETMEEILFRIQQREEAAVKRERAMAYAFSHQWRANSGQGQLSYEFGDGNWGWSWTERWIAARPWETRLPVQPTSPKKSKVDKKTNANSSRVLTPVKTAATNGKSSAKRILHKPMDEKAVPQETCPKPAATLSHPKSKLKQDQNRPPPQASGIAV
ncbi:protein IQ-DOMAIN 1 isoform X2 [Asparagus officinalis]|uniref:protein IQ-DOMAIN 1 isoform X2 n=1 Tax=Asparagus officinalis TaxID=4686 RepID=UPI00098E3EE0|nr:protein IQ-DOMAIN 1 isoform X2 [Asparagus officinalis]